MNLPVREQSPAAVVEVEDLGIVYRSGGTRFAAARDVSFTVGRGEIFGLVGETGSGKSTVLRAIIGLLHRNARIERGAIRVAGHEVIGASRDAMTDLRRSHMAMIFQDPLRALNPVMTVGFQLAEGLNAAGMRDREGIRSLVAETLLRVGIADPLIRMRAFPHELSGGLRQRVAVAAAIIRSPALILADEPTTALDVTIQDQILTLLRDLCREMGMSVVLVTHDIGVVAQTCDKVGVLYAGRLVETGDVARVLSAPSHPYTAALLASIPRLGQRRRRLRVIAGRPPDLALDIEGCPFASRCEHALAACATTPPVLRRREGAQATACWRHDQLANRLADAVA
jgi:oligopeptide/dipeptide ABC transporter ATP-binding protein